MGDPIFESARPFRVWLYTVGHRTLLLRSPATAEQPTRIDVLFKPTGFMALRTTLDGLCIIEAPADDPGVPAEVVGAATEETRIFALRSGDAVGWVVAGICAVHEDEGTDSDPSAFSVPRMVW